MANLADCPFFTFPIAGANGNTVSAASVFTAPALCSPS
jgi:hypothetical protein